MCETCRVRPCAINYHRDGQVHYRRCCDHCRRQHRGRPAVTAQWARQGYVKRSVCDLCKFRARYASQITVWHVDGDCRNCERSNLRSICRNCAEAVTRENRPWRPGGLEPDF